jgi:addiction module HigA family antidote
MTDHEKRLPAEAWPPSEYITGMMDVLHWSVDGLANHANLHPRVIRDVLDDGAPITTAIADGLARAFGTSSELWTNLQAAHTVWRKEHVDE